VVLARPSGVLDVKTVVTLGLSMKGWGASPLNSKRLCRRVRNLQPVRSAYQPPASSTFLSEQTSHQQSASSTFLSEQINTSHLPPAKRTGCLIKI
jgi:hypothetical protein